ncbi:MAG: hypothetical protein AB9919_00895 [Geobacteraceae bacterium]|jgi:hypothetical protein
MPKKALYIFLVAFVALLACRNVYAAVSVSPSSFSVARGQTGTVSLLYQFSGVLSASGAPLTGVLTSTNGIFLLTDSIIGTNPVPLVVNLIEGRGIASETVIIPASVIRTVLDSGLTTFTYRRSFSNGDAVSARVTITTDAAAAFSIKRVELYFDNRRAEITVPRHFPNLRAFADIRFTGSGVLEGYWEVDGRVISRVHQMLTFGSSVKLRTPEIPAMPTFDPGAHIVRFIITNRGYALPVPALVYFVTPEEFRPRPVDVGLKSPVDNSTLSRAAARFEWESFKGATLYLVEYYENPEERPLFSAYTREPMYQLPELASNDLFVPGAKYYWKVTGYNDKDNIVVESAIRSFTLQ